MAFRIPASFWRGGTSNGLLIQKQHLPQIQDDWVPLLCAAMGSPDPFGRQLNGMGGGVSSRSKICVVSKSLREDADVDYTFIQVGIEDASLDMAGNCGNMSSAVGPFALDEGLLEMSKMESMISSEDGRDYLTAEIFNTNTSKIIRTKFAIQTTNDKKILYQPNGNYTIDGVSGTASPIALCFLSPGGSKTGKMFPTGNRVDILSLRDGTTILVSLVDIANPGVFIRAEDIGVNLPMDPAILNQNPLLMAQLEEIRELGASNMGLDPKVSSVPKIVLISEPEEESDACIRCLALSMEKCHKAVPLTLALNLGVACILEGTIAWNISEAVLKKKRYSRSEISKDLEVVTIAHPSGKIDVKADVLNGQVESAILMRTARLLMRGEVNCSSSSHLSRL